MALFDLSFAGYGLIFILGFALGSYINSWVWRSATGKWRWGGRSECVHCGAAVAWRDNIPLLSFLVLGGVSRCCRRPIPQDYFWVELATGVLLVSLAGLQLNSAAINPLIFWRNVFFVILLEVIFIYDAKYQLIPTGVVWAGAIVGLVFNTYAVFTTFQPLVNFPLFTQYLQIVIYGLLLGPLVGWAWFALQYYASRGRWVGGGDVRLGAMLGVWFGWPLILVNLFLAYILGALVAGPLLLLGKKSWGSKLPFGTFLAVAGFVTLFWGKALAAWYLNFLK